MAIWHYVHRVKGILHDDYDYHQVSSKNNHVIALVAVSLLSRLISGCGSR